MKFVRPGAAARLTGVSRYIIREMISRGDVKVVQLDNIRLVDIDEVREKLQSTLTPEQAEELTGIPCDILIAAAKRGSIAHVGDARDRRKIAFRKEDLQELIK